MTAIEYEPNSKNLIFRVSPILELKPKCQISIYYTTKIYSEPDP